MSTRTNWAGSHRIAGGVIHAPRSLEALQTLVAGPGRLRVLGSGHTFNDLPDSRGDLISLASMPRQLRVDAAAGTVTIDGATSYGELCEPLDAAGFALEALASLPHISVAGACATGTHGSGDRVRSLAAVVTGLGIVRASGEHVTVDAGDATLPGLVVSLGAMGVVTSLTLAVVPAYPLRQEVFEALPIGTVLERFDELMALGHSVSLFTTWRDRTFHQLWAKRRPEDDPDGAAAASLGLRPASGPRHPIPGLDPAACTTQLGVVGPWFERLPHFRLDHTPSSGRELQSEYLVERSLGPAAVAALSAAAPGFRSVVQVSEVRTVAADDLWLSPASRRPSVALHFTWQPDPDAVRDALLVVERTLAPFDPRPHWGKLWTMPIDAVRASYPRLGDVVELRDRWDPEHRFANRYVDAVLGA